MRREMQTNSHPLEPQELMAYLDGELPVARAAEAVEHLAHCRECQAVAADLQSVSRQLIAWQVEVPQQGMNPGLAAALDERETRRTNVSGRNKGWLQRWPWAVGVGLAGACIVLLLFLPGLSKRESVSLVALRPQALLMAPAQAVAHDNESAPRVNTNGPLIVHTAQLTLTTKEFAKTRDALEAILRQHGGHIGQLSVNSPSGSARSLQATLRVPADQFQQFLVDLRKLGRVELESQGGEEVTQQVTDLEARLSNARTTEQRLAEILRQRTGKISDVLEVEKQIDRVRGEIEQMMAERKNLGDRVSYATVNVTIAEEYKAELQVAPPSAFGQLRNAAVEGYRSLTGSLVGLALFLLSTGPTLIVWAALLFFPARIIWRRFRRDAS
jgi:hypothetical protein